MGKPRSRRSVKMSSKIRVLRRSDDMLSMSKPVKHRPAKTEEEKAAARLVRFGQIKDEYLRMEMLRAAYKRRKEEALRKMR